MEIDIIIAAPRPWTIRAATRRGREPASPQANEAATKIAKPGHADPAGERPEDDHGGDNRHHVRRCDPLGLAERYAKYGGDRREGDGNDIVIEHCHETAHQDHKEDRDPVPVGKRLAASRCIICGGVGHGMAPVKNDEEISCGRRKRPCRSRQMVLFPEKFCNFPEVFSYRETRGAFLPVDLLVPGHRQAHTPEPGDRHLAGNPRESPVQQGFSIFSTRSDLWG
jgi:hypothetical protein